MAGKRITDAERETIRRLIAEGKDDETIAKITGRGQTTVWKIRQAIEGNSAGAGANDDSEESTADAAPEPESRVETAANPLPPPRPNPLDEKSDAERLDAARKASGVDPEIVGPAPPRGSGGYVPPKAPPPDEDAKAAAEELVNFSEFVAVNCARMYAKTKKVKVTAALLKSWKYAKEERDAMMQTAPYAAPYLKLLIAKLPVIMAIGCGFTHVMLTADRFAGIDEIAPPPVKKDSPDA